MYDKATFARQLRLLKDQRGLTQKEIADRLETTEATISRYVSGDRTPNIETAVELAALLGVSMDTLCGIDPPAVERTPPEINILTTCYKSASDEDRRVIWSFLNRYMSTEQKTVIALVMETEEKSAVS
ncbi:MAG: helix-turn-helix transcriptional regulator [Oscillospiraceae bacterium]|nr:helix-turn-helix transcriptional regulator [Oscillospiraceae bacterium]